MPTRLLLIAITTVFLAGGAALTSLAEEETPAGYYSANGLLNRGLYDLAEAEYREFLSEHGGHEKAATARYGLSVCLFRTHKYEEAAAELTRLAGVKDFAFEVEAGVMLGQSYLALEKYKEAIGALCDLVVKHKNHDLTDDAAAMLIEAYYRAGQYDAALTLGRRFDARWPKNPLRERTVYYVGLSQLATGDHAAAAGSLSEFLKAYPNGTNAEQAGLLLAQCRHRLGELDEAEAWYKKTLDGGDGELAPDALYGYALLLHRREQAARAGELLDRLLKEYPESKDAREAGLLRGRVWFELEGYEQAAGYFEQAAREKEHGEEATYWLAKCRLRQGRPGEAAELLRGALKRYSDGEWRGEMLYDLGAALTRAGHEEEAGGAFAAFLEEFGEHAMAADALAMLATIEHRAGEFEKSEELCEAFLREHGKHELAGNVGFIRAENLFMRHEYEEALEAYREFLAKHEDDERAPRAIYRTGMALFHLDRFDEAVEPLTDAAQRAGEDAAYQASELALGEIYFERSDWAAAETHFEAYLKRGQQAPAADDALLKLGLARQRLQKLKEAREAYERLLKEYDESPARLHARFELGQTLAGLGLSEEAAKQFEQVIKEGKDSRFAPYALNHLGAIAAARGEHAQAADYFAKASAEGDEAVASEALYQRGTALMNERDYEGAEKAFEEYVEKWPNGASAGKARAQGAIALSRQEKAAEALKAIERVEKAHTDSLDPPMRTALRHEQAWCLKKLGRVEEAEKLYGQLGENSCSIDMQAYALLERAELEAGRDDRAAAIATLRRLMDMQDRDNFKLDAGVRAAGLYRLGACLFETGEMQGATGALGKFLADYSEHELAASASYFMGEALFKLGRMREAGTHLTRVVEDFEKNEARGPAMLRLGECLAEQQHWSKSEEIFGDYLKGWPESEHWYQARFGRGWARENQQRYEEAIADYKAVVEKHKGATAARAQFQIGECLFAQKRLDDAVRELLKVDILYDYPEWSAAALFEAGRCFEQQGKTVEARAQYKAVKEKYAQTRWAALAEQRLAAATAEALPGRGRAD